MGGKSQHYFPRPPTREELGLDSEDTEDEGQGSDLNMSVEDPLLSNVQNDATMVEAPQSDLSGLFVSIPHVDATQLSQSAELDESFPEGHMVQSSDIVSFIQTKEKKIHVTQLQWDKTTTMGQIRSLNPTLVAHYARRLRASQPRKLVRILAKATTGMLVRRIGVTVFPLLQTVTTFPLEDSTSLQPCSQCSSPWAVRPMTLESLQNSSTLMLRC